MNRCPDPGAIRAALDGERADVERHLHHCEACRRRAEELGDDAAFAAVAFAATVPAADTDAALGRWRAEQVVVPLQRREPHRGPGLGRAAVALLLAVVTAGVLATPTGRAAAASLLERFRAERVAVVPFDVASVDPKAIEALARVAEVEGADRIARRQVPDAASASAVAGFDVAPLDAGALPAAVRGRVRVIAQAPQTVRVTFPDHADVPPAMRDVVLVLDVPGVVVQTIEGRDGEPVVVRGEAGSLEVGVEGGASLAEVRNALLSLPGLPAETVAALREIEDWETTLPLPVPVGDIAWEETTVAGHPAVAFGDESGLGSALLWHDGDHFVGVGGRLPLSQVRQLAEAG
jgi:hypothetical protein